MKRFLLKKVCLAVSGALLMSFALTMSAWAQDDDTGERRAHMEDRRQAMEKRRAEFLQNNPDAAARMEQGRREHEEFRANNPEAAARMEQHRAEHGQRGPGPGNARGPGAGHGERAPRDFRGPQTKPGSDAG